MSKYSILEDMDPPVIERIKFNSDQMNLGYMMNYQVLNLMKVELIMTGYYLSMITKMMSLFLKKTIQSFKGKFVLEVIDNANNRRTLNLNL